MNIEKQEKLKSALADYQKIVGAARAEKDKIVDRAWADYEKIRKELGDD